MPTMMIYVDREVNEKLAKKAQEQEMAKSDVVLEILRKHL